ncbi:hypothetical protein R5R35_007210 [Gryllus longicercus]|uniref:BTB domain-containing protein n=1 Tax=Gryllus longicercus TaxID=2509291 RepID=A0AAN9VJC2_9ORTH
MKSQNTDKVRISSKVLNSNMKRPRKKPLKPQRGCVPSLYGYASYRKVWCHLRKREQLCDGIIRTVDGEVIGVHRALLSAISPYFKAVFTNILQGGRPERTEVTVDISKNILETILDYAYTGHCRVSSANVEDLLSAADRYEVLGVVERCCYFLRCAMNSKNCLGISKFARLFCCTDLKNDAEKYILEKFHDVRQESLEFYELTAYELRNILENDNLNVRSEEAVFEAVAAWVSWNAPERKVFLPQLISCPRYGLMNEHYFWKVVQQYPRVTESSVS